MPVYFEGDTDNYVEFEYRKDSIGNDEISYGVF